MANGAQRACSELMRVGADDDADDDVDDAGGDGQSCRRDQRAVPTTGCCSSGTCGTDGNGAA